MSCRRSSPSSLSRRRSSPSSKRQFMCRLAPLVCQFVVARHFRLIGGVSHRLAGVHNHSSKRGLSAPLGAASSRRGDTDLMMRVVTCLRLVIVILAGSESRPSPRSLGDGDDVYMSVNDAVVDAGVCWRRTSRPWCLWRHPVLLFSVWVLFCLAALTACCG